MYVLTEGFTTSMGIIARRGCGVYMTLQDKKHKPVAAAVLEAQVVPELCPQNVTLYMQFLGASESDKTGAGTVMVSAVKVS